MSWRSFLFRQWRSHRCFSLWMTSCHPKGKAGWAQPDLRPDGDLTHGAGAVKLGGTRAPRAWEEPDFSVEADAQRHQSPCSDRRPDGRRKKEMKDRQRCQSEAEARLSPGSAIAVPAITISLKSSLSTARQHRREEPKPDFRSGQLEWAKEPRFAVHRLARSHVCAAEGRHEAADPLLARP